MRTSNLVWALSKGKLSPPRSGPLHVSIGYSFRPSLSLCASFSLSFAPLSSTFAKYTSSLEAPSLSYYRKCGAAKESADGRTASPEEMNTIHNSMKNESIRINCIGTQNAFDGSGAQPFLATSVARARPPPMDEDNGGEKMESAARSDAKIIQKWLITLALNV